MDWGVNSRDGERQVGLAQALEVETFLMDLAIGSAGKMQIRRTASFMQ